MRQHPVVSRELSQVNGIKGSRPFDGRVVVPGGEPDGLEERVAMRDRQVECAAGESGEGI
jgi:hypothetical protein